MCTGTRPVAIQKTLTTLMAPLGPAKSPLHPPLLILHNLRLLQIISVYDVSSRCIVYCPPSHPPHSKPLILSQSSRYDVASMYLLTLTHESGQLSTAKVSRRARPSSSRQRPIWRKRLRPRTTQRRLRSARKRAPLRTWRCWPQSGRRKGLLDSARHAIKRILDPLFMT